jgi:hypothetical protein
MATRPALVICSEKYRSLRSISSHRFTCEGKVRSVGVVRCERL